MPAPKKPEGRRQAHNADRYKVLALAERPISVPKPPDGLLKATKDMWIEFWSSDVARAVQPADVDGLVRLIQYRDEWQRLMDAYRKCRFVEGSTGQVKVNPALTSALALEGAMGKLAADLGLSPMARMRLGIAVGQATKTIEELRNAADPDEDIAEGADPRLASVVESPQDR